MRRDLHKTDRNTIMKLQRTAHAFDLNKDGYYDSLLGCINIWCSPTDKPVGWDKEIKQGGLPCPRDYVGGLYWDWLDTDQANLYLDCTPYALLVGNHRYRYPVEEQLSSTQWGHLFSWLEKKVTELLRLAALTPALVGTKCPFCAFTIPINSLLNNLLDHIVETHTERKVSGITLSNPIVLHTDHGDVALEDAEDWSG